MWRYLAQTCRKMSFLTLTLLETYALSANFHSLVNVLRYEYNNRNNRIDHSDLLPTHSQGIVQLLYILW